MTPYGDDSPVVRAIEAVLAERGVSASRAGVPWRLEQSTAVDLRDPRAQPLLAIAAATMALAMTWKRPAFASRRGICVTTIRAGGFTDVDVPGHRKAAAGDAIQPADRPRQCRRSANFRPTCRPQFGTTWSPLTRY